jgi:acetyl/propionyl-CoA carboxylase alpha subunit
MIRFRCGGEEVEAAALPVDAVEPVSPGVFLWRHGDGLRTFHCVVDGRRLHLFWDGIAYVLERLQEGARPAARHGAEGLEAPMPGRVIAVRVAPGDEVTRGQELLVIEAMKMENSVRAPRDGIVDSVAAKVGDMVGPGAVLVELR